MANSILCSREGSVCISNHYSKNYSPMKRKLIFNTALPFVLCALLAGTANAQSRTITLKEAVDLTLTNNKALKIDSSKIIEASIAITEARDRRMPDVSV